MHALRVKVLYMYRVQSGTREIVNDTEKAAPRTAVQAALCAGRRPLVEVVAADGRFDALGPLVHVLTQDYGLDVLLQGHTSRLHVLWADPPTPADYILIVAQAPATAWAPMVVDFARRVRAEWKHIYMPHDLSDSERRAALDALMPDGRLERALAVARHGRDVDEKVRVHLDSRPMYLRGEPGMVCPPAPSGSGGRLPAYMSVHAKLRSQLGSYLDRLSREIQCAHRTPDVTPLRALNTRKPLRAYLGARCAADDKEAIIQLSHGQEVEVDAFAASEGFVDFCRLPAETQYTLF